MMSRVLLTLLYLVVGSAVSAAEKPADNVKKPSILIVNGTGCAPMI